MKKIDYSDKIALAANQKIKERDYWLKRLSGDFVKSNFPYDFKSSEDINTAKEMDEVRFECPGDLFEKLMKLSSGIDIKLHMILVAGLAVLLYKYTNSEDVVTGSPIIKQKIGGQFINTVLVYRNRLRDTMSFKELLLQARETVIKAAAHQNYPVEFLADRLNLAAKGDEFPLFDVVLLLENIHDRQYLEGIDYHILFSFFRTGESINFSIRYQPWLYLRETIERIAAHFMCLSDQVLGDVNMTLSAVDLLSEAEKQQLVVDFNNSKTDFPKKKTITALFQEQVERTPNHTALVGSKEEGWKGRRVEGKKEGHLTYKKLNERANQLAHLLREKGVGADAIVGIMVERSIDMMVGLLGILKAGGAYLPIEPGYPQERVSYMLSDSKVQVLIIDNSSRHFNCQLSIVNCQLSMNEKTQPAIVFSNSQLAYVIYTSGSTGKPKGVLVEHRNVAANLFAFFKEFEITAKDTVIQLTPYVFDTFVEEVFPVLTRGGKIVIPPGIQLPGIDFLSDFIVKHNVSIIDCTPLLLKEFNRFDRIRGVTIFISGGDVLRREYVDHFLTSGNVYNTYGPTEATICAAYYRCPPGVSSTIPIGKPIANYNVYILDANSQLQPIGVTGELCIGGPGVTRGYLNRPELTAEKFCLRRPGGRFLKKLPRETSAKNFLLSNLKAPGKGIYMSHMSYMSYIYQTGDLARWLWDGNIEFLGRMDSQVKVRGYRIELGEIEALLGEHEDVNEAVVVQKVSETNDKFLCGYVISNKRLDAEDMREFLGQKLPDYMVPWFYVQMDRFPLTPSGKIDRKALPAPEISSETRYVAPRNQTEKKLLELWIDVLGGEKENIGIDNNFFDLGGNSLKAIVMISKMHKELNIKLQMTDIFKLQTIRGISESIKEAPEDRFISIEPVEKQQYYKLAPAQKRLYVLQQMDLESTAYNMPLMVELDKELEKPWLEGIFKRLIERHESLRTSFEVIEDEPFQRVHEVGNYKFQITGYKQIPNPPAGGPYKVDDIIKDFIRPFDLSQAPLLRAGLIKTGKTKHILMVDLHHITTDGTSQNILRDEFMLLFEGTGEQLPVLRLQYKDYSQWLNGPEQQEMVKRQEDYWLGLFPGELPVLTLPLDFPRPGSRSFAGSSLQFAFHQEETTQLKDIAKKSGATLYMILLAIFTILLSKLSGLEDIIVGTPVIARRHEDLQKIMGMFVNTLVMRSYPSGDKTYGILLTEIKEQTLNAYENQEYPFEDLVDKIAGQRDTGRNPVFDVMFNLLDLGDYPGDIPESNKESQPDQREYTSKFDLNLTAVDLDKRIYFSLGYCTKLFKESTIYRVIEYFKKITRQVLESKDRELELSNIEVITAEEKRRLLIEFNDTKADFPRDKTLHRLFEEQVEKTPNQIALVGGMEEGWKGRRVEGKKEGETISITYKELNNKSNQLAHLLIEKGVQPDTIVGLMMERSIEMIIGILGILKAGGAYLPIEPDYPDERIKFMLADSGANVLVTTSTLTEEVKKLRSLEVKRIFQIIFVDSYEFTDISPSHLLTFSPSSSLAYIIYTSGSTGKPKGVMVEHKSLVNYVCWAMKQYIDGKGSIFPLYTSISFDLTVTSIFLPLISGNRVMIYPEDENQLAVLKVIEESGVDIVKLTPSHLGILSTEMKTKNSRINTFIVGGEKLESTLALDIHNRFPGNPAIYNEYGPTEATVGCMIYKFDKESAKEGAVPIGVPIENVKIYILDNYLKPVPTNVIGEIYIGGAALARGYLNNPELAAQKFVISHLSLVISSSKKHSKAANDQCPMTNDRLYQTGDLAKPLPDGNIEFLGRRDQQVKIRGYRIELGEIENRLLNSSEIKEAVVVAREEADGDRYLCAYIVPAFPGPAGTRGSTGAFESSGLREFLSEELPGYMVPPYIVPLDEIPLTPNGKVDRKALPKPVPEAAADYAAPGNALEEKLVEIWLDVLGLSKDGWRDSRKKRPIIGINDNFFEIGGHSLKATILASRIHKELNVKIPLAEVFKHQTVKELATYINGAEKNEYVGIEPVEKKEYYPLSPAQKRLYFLQQLDPESTAYNVPLVVSIEKDIARERLELVLKRLIARHESLRTSFVKVDEVPYQEIHDEVAFEIEYFSMPHASLTKNFIRAFDLSRVPLMRVGVINHESPGGLLVFDMHHIVTDERSHHILPDEFITSFNDIDLQLPPLRLQYKDYSQWLHNPEQEKMVKRQEAYWIQLLSDELPVLTLPLDYPRPGFRSFAGSSMQFLFNREETKHLQDLSKKSGTTLYMTLLSIFNILAAKLSGLEDIIVGTPIAARRHADLQKIIGMFVNTIVMRSYPSGHKTFAAFLNEIKTQSLMAFENQEYPFEDLVDKVLVKRDTSRNPVFDVMFTFISDAEYPGDIPGADEEPQFEYKKLTSKFDLNFTAVDLGKRIFFDLEYCTKLFKEDTIGRIIQYFKKITHQVIESQTRDLKLSSIEVITGEEKRRLLVEFNDTKADFPRDKTIHQLFEEQVARIPNQIALVGQFPGASFGGNIFITYKELNRQSDRLARLLIDKGVKLDSIVGLMVERSIEMITGMLAVLKAGGAYLPIDAEYPEARQAYMIKDSSIKVLLTNYDNGTAGEGASIPAGIEVIDLRDQQVYQGNTTKPGHTNHPPGLVYLIYTSGSTGKPKGVMLEHRNLVNLLIWGFRFTNLDFSSVLQFATISFDASFHEIFSTLLTGGQLVLVPKEMRTDIPKLFDLIEKNHVKTLFLPISLLKVIFSEEDYIETFPACVAHIQTAGEQVVVSDPFSNYLKEHHIYLHNHYGPSEAHVVTALTMAPQDEIPILPPIGKPVSNTEIYILDKYGTVQPEGVPGELYIGGVQVGRGYLNRPELTAEKFILAHSSWLIADRKTMKGVVKFPMSYQLSAIGYIYRTGDLARWLWDGNIEFLGRIDHQVKIRGFRIELGEIEARLLKHNSIKEAVVVLFTAEAIGTPGGEKYLCAYIVRAGAYEETLKPGEVREFLSQTLPDYMIPSYFIPVDKIPLTPNGKVDRKALPKPSADESTPGKSRTPPGNEIEIKLVKIWSDVLREETFQASIGIDDNFFELGGHSLTATILASKIHKELKVKVPLAQVFKGQTIRGLSKYIREAAAGKYAGIEPVEKREYYVLSSAQKRLYFLRQIDHESTSYNMTLILSLGKDIKKNKLESVLKQLIARHENLRTSFERMNEEPVQRIHDEVEFSIEYYDLYRTQVEVKVKVEESEGTGGLAPLPIEPATRSPQPAAALISSFIRPFDLSRAPLMRSGLITLPGGHQIWLVDMHHIISDGTSHTILTEDFLALYKGKKLKPLRLHYKDFSQWQNRLFESGEIKGQEDYWLELLSGEIPRLELPFDYKRPEIFTFAGDRYLFNLEEEEALEFKALGNKYGATLYMNILAALNTLFYKYTGQTDMIVGTGIAGRPHADLQHIIGMFINTLAMRNTPEGEKTYEYFLKEVAAVSVKAFENQDVQFEELVEKLDLERDPSRNPLFDITMVVQNFRSPGEGREVLPSENKDLPSIIYNNPTTKFDMTFFVHETGDDISVIIEYYTGIFKQETVKRLVSHFKNVIQTVIKIPSLKLKDIDILSREEKEQLLFEFNDTLTGYPGGKTIHDLFGNQVEKVPDSIALVCEGEALTYRTLAQTANRLACYLYEEKRVGAGEPVGVWMSQSLYRPAVLLGVLQAGGAFVPLDPAIPPGRIKYIINDARIGTVFSEKQYLRDLNRLQWECENFHSYLCIDSFDIHAEDEQERNQLMDKELWHHVGETADDEITGGGWLSSYTGEPLPKAEMNEYGDNILKKLEPLLHPKMQVLEIGCASGITMYRIAPKVDLYHGTDLSAVIIEKNKKKVREKGYHNIKLSCLAAHQIHRLKPGNKQKKFDLIIMNSVIQCFHGHNYLRKVIGKAIDLLGDHGYLFIGDIMDQQKKNALVRELTAFKKANKHMGYTTKTDFSSELFVPQRFWQDLESEWDEIETVKCSDKIFAIENELTKFRYDALLKVNKVSKTGHRKTGKADREKIKYQEDMGAVSRFEGSWPGLDIRAGHPAYIIYTSGTTGNPKGIIIEHQGIANLNTVFSHHFHISSRDHIIQFANISFDASVWEIFMALLNGGSLHLLKPGTINDYDRFHWYLVRNCITVATLPPPYANHLNIKALAALRILVTAGSSASMDFIKKCKEVGHFQYINAYGPTENTVCASYWDTADTTDVTTVTIGKPINNTAIYIMDAHMSLKPPGAAGELCISSVGLARGYLNNQELTAERFCLRRPGALFEKTAPVRETSAKNFLLKAPGKRIYPHMSHTSYMSYIYKTGDLARWLWDGNIEFLGRIDLQVKIRGFRIELGEIEARLKAHDSIKEAVVTAASIDIEEKHLCAYIVSQESIAGSEVKEFLSTSLPGYMIPSYVVQIDKIPLTPSGKVDRKSLPAPGFTGSGQYAAPGTEIQKKLAAIWSEVLHINKNNISIHANFFDLGGHSLKAAILTAKIHKELKVKVPLAEIFKHQTIEGLSRYMEDLEEDIYSGIVPVEKKEYYALSSAQKRLYFLQRLDFNNTTYNMPLILPLGKDIEKDKLEQTLKQLIARHESLRTSLIIVNDEPVQRVHDEVEFGIEYFSMEQGAGGRGHANLIKNFIRPFDLARAPLIRSGLITLPGGQQIWLVDMHHIVSDGTSHMILTDDFMALYNWKELKPLQLHYKDFSQWQNNLFKSGEFKAQEDYWLELFSGEIPRLEPPVDYKRPDVFTFAGSRYSFMLDREDALAFNALGNKSGVTLYMNFLAGLNTLFYKYTGQTDIIIGGAIAGRPHADLQHIIGMFVNTLAMRNTPDGEKTYESFLKEAAANSIKAFENQDVQFEGLVDKLDIERDTSRNPLFDITMVVQNFRKPGEEDLESENEGQLEVLPLAEENSPAVDYKTTTTKFDLTFLVHEIGDDILVSIEYYTGIFKEETIRRLAAHFERVVKTVIHDPLIKLRNIEIIPVEEKEEILFAFNDTAGDYPRDKRIHQLFTGQVEKNPDQIALVGGKEEGWKGRRVEGGGHLTFKELDERANQLAHLLREKGVGADAIVGIMVERSIELIIGLLGILKAGGAYLPIDPGYPAERVSYMLSDSMVQVLIIDNSSRPSWLSPAPQVLLNLSAGHHFDFPSSHLPIFPSSRPASLAYVLYTSGTSGQPKGVMVEHRNVVRLVKNTDYVEFNPGERILQTGAPDFDASTFEIWGALLNGLTLCLALKEEIISARLLKENIRKHHITILWMTSPLFNQMAEEDIEIFSGLRHFLVGGDVLSPRHINMLKKQFPGLKVTNGYGPTENTTFSTTLLIDKEYTEAIPIGKPIANSTVYIVDNEGHVQPKGLPGEIWVGGDGVSRGYLNNPELTAEKFILATKTQRHKEVYFSWCLGALVAKLYKTGDLARWQPDGNIEFLGRIDNQVKIRGFRIELEEIENQLSSHTRVNEAVVLVKRTDSREKHLCAYVVPGTVDVEGLKEYLAHRVPPYMVPAFFVTLKKLPLTPSGKVDRKALSQSGEFHRPANSTYASPGSRLEKLIARAWQEALNLEEVGLLDNFFDMGGNSINLLKVHRKLEKALTRDIPIVKLFEHPTIRSLAVFLGQGIEDEEENPLLHPGENVKSADIAVIGMAGVFPGAKNVHEFWENLKNGVESITFFANEELTKVGIPAGLLKDPNYVRAKGTIDAVEYFDASFFDYTPKEATIMDPQVRIFHQCVWHALEDAGYDPFSYPQRIGLYAGSTSNIYWEALTMLSSAGRFFSGVRGTLLRNRDFMCTRISYKLNLKGPSFSVQTACSTSLVAIHLACQGLLNRECEMALAGGVTISAPGTQGYYYQEGMIESPDGHCRAFDASSNGLVGGNGSGVVVLKPYEKAIEDGDHIDAIIKGSAINNDGLRKVGYTAPSVEGQAEVIRNAQLIAGIEPASITYIETHGTGTELGDPVEVEALKKAFKRNKRGWQPFPIEKSCGIGSVKTNVGHLDAAAGVTGFIKTVLALKHRLIPPTLHFKTPNPKLGIENSPFYVVSRLTGWKVDGYPRRAGVSSLGIGGTNAHVVLEEWPVVSESVGRGGSPCPPSQLREYQLILLSAKTKSALGKVTQNLVNHFNNNSSIHLGDAAYTLQVGRNPLPYRKMVVCATVTDAVETLSATSKNKQKRAQTFFSKTGNPPVLFIFSGQGSQYVNMGLGLYETEPVFQAEMDRCFEIVGSIGYDLKEILYPGDLVNKMSELSKVSGEGRSGSPKGRGVLDLNRTVIIQLLIFIFAYALAALLMKWGIRPAAMIGYSLGEYAAACLAGIFSLEDALKLVAARGELIQTTPGGAMLSVPLREKQIKPLLNKDLSLAIANGPSCVVAGSTAAVAAFENQMKKKRLLCTRVNISHAIHSRLMHPLREKFENKVKEVKLNRPRIPLISDVSGDWLTDRAAIDPGYWAEQLCAPVRFSDGIDQLLKEENAVFIEIGPGRVLGNIIRQHPHKKPGQMVVNLVRHQQEKAADDYLLLRAIGQLWLYGLEIDWPEFYPGQKRYRLPLPVYPFESKRYWIDEDIFQELVARQSPAKDQEPEPVQEAAEPGQSPDPPGIAPEEEDEEYEPPRNELEQNIATIWQEFLGFEKIGIYDNFFHLNGDSLTATQLITRVKELYPVEVTMQDFFAEPTIAHLAQTIKKLLIEKIKNLSPEEKKKILT
jgi:amino acid adenylation domain-containing protein